MALTCAVKNCSNGAYWLNKWKNELCCRCGCLHKEKECNCDPPFRLHTFPTKKKNPEMRERWKQLIGRSNGGKLWSPPKDSRVCSEHFEEGNPTARHPFPTHKLGYEGFESRVKRILYFKQDSISQPSYKCVSFESEEYLTATKVPAPDPPLEELKPSEHWLPLPIFLILIIRCMVDKYKQQTLEVKRLKYENIRLRNEVKQLKRQKYVDSIISTDNNVNFFTGLPSKSVFEKLHSLISPLVNRRWRGMKGSQTNTRYFNKEPSRFGPERKLPSRAEFLLTLMRLRLGLLGRDLASRFEISESLCGRIFLTWLRASAKVLGAMVFSPDEETLIATKPQKFKHIQDLHSIIDCTEVFIETPKDLELQSATWSDYKHHNTLKILVACSPNSAITYISPAYMGRISDKALTLDCGYLDNVPDYAVIMADKGFNIKTECEERNITLYVPPGKRGQSQMCKAAIEKTKKIANTRILIEQVIRRIKTFRIIQHELPVSLIPHTNDILNVCAGICNMKGPIYK